MSFCKSIVFLFFICLANNNLFAQKADSTLKKTDSTTKKTVQKIKPKKEKVNIFSIDTSKPYNPRVAILRSAIIPGWGQATNKKYWKMPIVWGALGTTAYIFRRNIKQFKAANAAYKNAIDNDTSNDYLIPEPYHSVLSSPDRIKSFRNSVRQNVDYSVLFFIAFWGLNVVDAAVDAHLKTFDVSDDLTLLIKPGYSPMANTNGISLVLNIGKTHAK
ncbi:DUF5683 domain-containing protein [Ferruginibacter sp. SUN106]|uniref:DUF5683 domain-containing protein n=1 Tax=Ferruginibacter sp. SUN106 TaxID=2978348 RepID=UPI003D35B5FA